MACTHKRCQEDRAVMPYVAAIPVILLLVGVLATAIAAAL